MASGGHAKAFVIPLPAIAAPARTTTPIKPSCEGESRHLSEAKKEISATGYSETLLDQSLAQASIDDGQSRPSQCSLLIFVSRIVEVWTIIPAKPDEPQFGLPQTRLGQRYTRSFWFIYRRLAQKHVGCWGLQLSSDTWTNSMRQSYFKEARVTSGLASQVTERSCCCGDVPSDKGPTSPKQWGKSPLCQPTIEAASHLRCHREAGAAS